MNKYSSRKFWLAVVSIVVLFIIAILNEVDVQLSIVGIYSAYVAGNAYQKNKILEKTGE